MKVFASGNLSVKQGELVNGAKSGASGPLEKIFDRSNVEVVPLSDGTYNLTNEQVYTMVLSNHNGRSFNQNETLSIPSVTLRNNTEGNN